MIVRVQQEDFDAAAETRNLAQTEAGAIVTFTGLVRSDDHVTSLTLEHYPGMTEREIGHHVREATERWPLCGVTVIHRIGTLAVGDNIVLVAVAAAHRQAAFEAAQFLLDYLKMRAPFWKREQRGEQSEWVEARASDCAAATRWRRD